jgi:hypothetical protein
VSFLILSTLIRLIPASILAYDGKNSSFTFPDPAGTGFTSNAYNGQAGWGIVVPPTPPAPPVLVSPGTAITFTWAAAAGATKYYLEVNTAADFTGTVVWDGEVGNVTSKDIGSLSLGVTYYWRVKADNDGGWSAWSAIWSIIASLIP